MPQLQAQLTAWRHSKPIQAPLTPIGSLMTAQPDPIGQRPILCFVVGHTQDTAALAQRVAEVVAAGVDWLHLRERDLDGAPLLAWCEVLAQSARRAAASEGRPVQILVNRRIDVALSLGADGVHLGFDALPAAETRRLIGQTRTIGVSTHHPDEVLGAANAGADYAHLAPIFDPFSKEATRPSLGLQALRAACAGGLPVLAQGGLNPARAAEARKVGALGVAVTGALLHAENPGATTREFRVALDSAAAPSS